MSFEITRLLASDTALANAMHKNCHSCSLTIPELLEYFPQTSPRASEFVVLVWKLKHVSVVKCSPTGVGETNF